MAGDDPTYLTVDDILDLHDDAVEGFGGEPSVRDQSALERAVERPKTAFGGTQRFPDIPSKAAALFHGLVQGHAFVDGNKRAATVAAMVFLELNGFRLDVDEKTIGDVAIGAASGEYSVDKLVDWFHENAKATGK